MAEQQDATPARADPGRFLADRLDSLVRTAFLLVGDHHGAEDLVMNAMGRCLPHWESITGDPLPYVRKAIVREYLSWLRRLRIVREDPTGTPPESAGEDEYDRTALRIDLLVALDRLPRRQRAVVVLRYLDDLTAGQVADILQISEGTVRSHTHDALTTLRASAPDTLRSYLSATADDDRPVTQ